MWLILAFVSAALLGLYDTSKKASLKDNAVLPVLLLNTIFSTFLTLPFLVDYTMGIGWFSGTIFDTDPYDLALLEEVGHVGNAHLLVVIKAFLVLS
jgi:transporter family protein